MIYGDETVCLLELYVPRCALTYGTAPCTAALGTTGMRKCFNTKKTCQSPANFTPTDTVTLRFARQQEGIEQYGPVIPSLQEVNIAPLVLNLAGMNDQSAAFGQRETVTVKLDDHLHSDSQVDKYRLERYPLATVSKGFESDLWITRDGTSSPTGYVLNQDIVGESTFAPRIGPYGDLEVVNVCRSLDTPVGDPGPDGGWTMGADQIPIDSTKGHLFLVWVKRLSANGINGQFYWGLHTNSPNDIKDLAGTNNVNPYFQGGGISTYFPNADQWYLAVGYVHASAYAGASSGIAGIYDKTGTLVAAGSTEYKWQTDSTACGHRAYHYYNTTISPEAQQMTRPVVVPCTEAEAPGIIKRYAVDKGYDPSERGTFWGKFLARNPYYLNMPCAVYTGTIGQPLSAMRKQNYLLARIDGPADGKVQLNLKDLFSLVEARKAVAPKASLGRLQADVAIGAGSATLTPAGVGATYGTSGYVRIGSECIAFTRSGDVLTLTQRGALHTSAAAHTTEDAVQEVLTFIAQRAHDIVYTLATGYTNLPAAAINYANWSAAASSLLNLYTAYITTPTPVADLIGELGQQAGFTIWPDVIDNTVHFKALVASTPSDIVDDFSWIVDGSYKPRRDDAKRASLIAVYYGQIDPTKSLSEETNFYSRVLSADSSGNYTTDSTRKVFSRWITQFGRTNAQACGDRLLAMFSVPPLEAKFKHHASLSGVLTLAELFYLSTAETQDDTGAVSTVTMAPVSIAYGEEENTISAQEVRFAPPVDPTAERVIYIDANSQNLNLRSVFDSLYPPPTGVEVVTFEVSNGITVGSSSVSLPALRKGTWPVGCAIKLRVMSGARVQGKGGHGGHGGGDGAPFTINHATAGENGGNAVDADGSALTIDNLGQIFGGAGGGGGGEPCGPGDWYGGGGGGGGAGSDAGDLGTCSYNFDVDGGVPDPTSGAAGTRDAGGAGGYGGHGYSSLNAGNGGAGGGPGLDGTTGDSAYDGTAGTFGGGGPGGTKGNYIVGNAFVTWLGTGDRRGGVA